MYLEIQLSFITSGTNMLRSAVWNQDILFHLEVQDCSLYLGV